MQPASRNMARSGAISVSEILRILEQIVRLTPDDAVRVARLLRSREDWTRECLAQSLAALLATDPESWRDIHGRVSRLNEGDVAALPASTLAPRDADPPAVPGRPALPAQRRPLLARLAGVRKRFWTALVAVLVAAPLMLVWLFRADPLPPPRPDIPKASPPQLEPASQPEQLRPTFTQRARAVPIPGPDPTATLDWQVLPAWLLLAISVTLVLLGARWSRLPGQARARLQAERKRGLRERERVTRAGQVEREPYHFERAPPFAEAYMDDAATVLGRAGRSEAGPELDVDDTIARTARAGGRVQPAYRPWRRPEPLLVLVDVEKGHHPFLDEVDWVLARWRRTGLAFERYDYGFRPTTLRSEHGGPPVELSALGRRHASAPLLLLSRMDDPVDYGGRMDWLHELAPWPARVLVDVDPRPDHERPGRVQAVLAACVRARLPRYPFAPDGLVAAARALGGDPGPVPERPNLPPLGELEDAVRLWAACAAYVPNPAWSHLQALRRLLPELARALPEYFYLQRLIELAEREGRLGVAIAKSGRSFHMEAPERLACIERERRRAMAMPGASGFEDRARKLIIEQLLAATPVSEFGRRMRDLKITLHEVELGLKPPTALLEHAGTAVDDEVHRMVGEARELQARGATRAPWDTDARESLEPWHAGEARVPLAGLLRASWRRFDARYAVAAVAAAGLMWLAAGATLPAPESERDYLPPVWQLELPHDGEAFGALDDPPTGRKLGEREVAIEGARPMRLVVLSGGEFTMGSPESETRDNENADVFTDERPRHRVRLSGFEICKHEVTQGQWKAVMGQDPSDCDYGCGDARPVQNVSWYDTIEFLNRLSDREKLTRCYEVEGERVEWQEGCTGYRLPTEVEWEYAARAGTQTAYSFGDDEGKLGEHAWYSENAGNKVHEVGTRAENPWGLHDVHGNVWEWVWDWYGPYGSEAVTDPRGPGKEAEAAGSVVSRVVRGGSFDSGARYLRSALRFGDRPRNRVWSVGLRCARGVSPAWPIDD